jgi:hypothetical protein
MSKSLHFPSKLARFHDKVWVGKNKMLYAFKTLKGGKPANCSRTIKITSYDIRLFTLLTVCNANK